MTNNCKEIGLQDRCQLTLPPGECIGIVDVNGDGKKDLVSVRNIYAMTADEFVHVSPGDSYIVYNGTPVSVLNDPHQYAKKTARIPYAKSDASASFRVGDRVIYEGKEYRIFRFIPYLGCKSRLEPFVEHDKSVAVILPSQLFDKYESDRRMIDDGWERYNALLNRFVVLTGDEKIDVGAEASKLKRRIESLEEELGTFLESIGDQFRPARIDELQPAKEEEK